MKAATENRKESREGGFVRGKVGGNVWRSLSTMREISQLCCCYRDFPQPSLPLHTHTNQTYKRNFYPRLREGIPKQILVKTLLRLSLYD
jgi:hypothetical protein